MISTVVFDLGGVLVRVARTWQEAADTAGVPCNHPHGGSSLNDFCGILEYQADKISLETYLSQLQEYLGLADAEEAYRVHMSILMETMAGTPELINEIELAGRMTACLSNTNASHWVHLASPDYYPHIAGLKLLAASHLYRVEKPDPAIFERFEADASASGREILFFDDGPANVEAAREFGWNAELIDPLRPTADQMRKHLGSHGVLV